MYTLKTASVIISLNDDGSWKSPVLSQTCSVVLKRVEELISNIDFIIANTLSMKGKWDPHPN